jgi:hypothetical protein
MVFFPYKITHLCTTVLKYQDSNSFTNSIHKYYLQFIFTYVCSSLRAAGVFKVWSAINIAFSSPALFYEPLSYIPQDWNYS